MIKGVIEQNFEEEILKSDLPVLLAFCAPWCNPCSKVYSMVEKLSEKSKVKVKFYKLNVDKAQETASKYGITSIPTLMFFRKGKALLNLSLLCMNHLCKL